MRFFPLLLVALALMAFPFIDYSFKGSAQLVVACLVAGIALVSKQTLLPIPKSLPIFVLSGSIVGALFHYSHLGLQPGGFLVATVTDSDLREDVKIYRDRLRKSIESKGRGAIGLYAGSVTSEADAQEVLARSTSLGGIIWGNERWTTVSFQRVSPKAIEDIAGNVELSDVTAKRSIASFLLVRGIPSLGLSDGHSNASVDFVSNIAFLWSKFFFSQQEQRTLEDLDAALASIASSRFFWTSRSHLAMPNWMLGNLALNRSIESSLVERGYLLCAIRHFKIALKQGKVSDNPSLGAAIRNNLAAALFLRSYLQGSGRKTRKIARRHLLNAIRLKGIDAAIRAVIHHNVRMLTLQKKNRGRKRRQH